MVRREVGRIQGTGTDATTVPTQRSRVGRERQWHARQLLPGDECAHAQSRSCAARSTRFCAGTASPRRRLSIAALSAARRVCIRRSSTAATGPASCSLPGRWPPASDPLGTSSGMPRGNPTPGPRDHHRRNRTVRPCRSAGLIWTTRTRRARLPRRRDDPRAAAPQLPARRLTTQRRPGRQPFRDRTTKLGDIVSSSPLFVGRPPFRYRDNLEGPERLFDFVQPTTPMPSARRWCTPARTTACCTGSMPTPARRCLRSFRAPCSATDARAHHSADAQNYSPQVLRRRFAQHGRCVLRRRTGTPYSPAV